MGQVFIVKNISSNIIELRDFGFILTPNLTVDLGNFDESVLSDQLNNYLLNNDLVRLINDVSVPYNQAYTTTTQVYNFDSSTIDGSINKLFAQDITINASFGFYATNASIGIAGFLKNVDLNPYATNSSVGLAGFIKSASLGPYATNASVGLALNPYATNASVGLAFYPYATNASIGLAGFLNNTSLYPYATNASVG
jgi:hypothetical protein